MVTASLDFSELLKGLPEGAWVAISERDNKVMAYSADLQTTLNQAKERGENDPSIVRVPERANMLFL